MTTERNIKEKWAYGNYGLRFLSVLGPKECS